MKAHAGILANAVMTFISTYDPTNDIVNEIAGLPESPPLRNGVFNGGHLHFGEVLSENIELEIESVVRPGDYNLSVAVHSNDGPPEALYTLMETQYYNDDPRLLTLTLPATQKLPESAMIGMIGQPLGKLVQMPSFLSDLATLLVSETRVMLERPVLSLTEKLP